METSAYKYPGNGPAMIRLCFEIKRSFETAERQATAHPDVAMLIDHPRMLSDHAMVQCLNVMRKLGEMRPTICLLSRYTGAIILLENIPGTFEEEVGMSVPLRVLLATAPIEAYWLAAEMWAADCPDDLPEATRALQVRDRPDRREGLLINTATRAVFLPRYFDVERRANGKPHNELVEQMDFFRDGATTMQNLVFRNLFEGADKITENAVEMLRSQS